MSILIKGMEMPTNCGDCYFEQIGAEEDVYGAEEDVYGDTCISYCLLTEWRIALSNRDDMKLPSCPLVEIDDTEWECEFIDRKEAIEAYKASHQIEIDIVRCGECKWGEELAPEIIYCDDMVGGAMRRTDFCSYGERRTDE